MSVNYSTVKQILSESSCHVAVLCVYVDANASPHLPCLLPWHWQHWLSGGNALLARLAHYSGARSGLAAPPYLKLLKSIKLPAPHTSATVNTPWSFDGLWCFGGHCLLHFLTSKLIPFLSATFHMVPICTHASKPSISQSQQIVDKKRLSALQHVLPANTLINDRRKHVQTKCSPVVFLTLNTSNMALQCHVQSYSTLVITGYHWLKTHIRPNSGNLWSCFGQALPSHCHASFSWSLFSVATSRPHSSWKLKSRQDDSARGTSQKSNHVWLDIGMREEGQLDTEAYHVIWTLNIQYLSVRAQVYALN